MRIILFSFITFFASLSCAYANDQSLSALDLRIQEEQQLEQENFALLAHKPNYLLFANYNLQPNQAPWQGLGGGTTPIKRTESNFQISFKTLLGHDLFMPNDGLFLAYTQKSFWQIYNKTLSSPFRDTNYNPELFYRMRFAKALGESLTLRTLSFGIEHESNGRADPLSRSWNRLYSTAAANTGNLLITAKLWWRIPEQPAKDNNPDIARFLGYSELYAHYKKRQQVFGLMLRPNISHKFKSSIKLDYSFPLHGQLKGYVQYYNGYGESLIDYNHRNQSFGFGIALSHWL